MELPRVEINMLRSSPKIFSVLAVLPSVIPSAFIYTIRPLNVLAEQGKLKFRYMLEKDVQPADFEDVDLVIFSRNQDPRFRPLLEQIRTAGIAVIYDLDDNFWEIPVDMEVGRRHRLPERMKQLEHYLKNSDLVRVYNPLVAEHVREYNANVFQAVPGIDFSLVPPAPLPKADEKIRIAYMTARGADDPLYDLFLPDLKEVLEMFPERVEAVLWKECPPALQAFPNVRVMPVEYDYEAFLRTVSRAGYDIGLAPILNNRFFISKTNTKFRDYGACRIAGIYSQAPIYSQDIIPGENGLVVDQAPGAWRAAMVRLIQDPALRESIQEAAFQYVYDHFRQEIMEEEWLAILNRLPTRKIVIPSAQVKDSDAADTVEKTSAATAPETGPSSPEHAQPDAGWKGLAIRSPGQPPLTGFQTADFDLDRPFPFADDTFDVVYASDPLTGVSDLLGTMREIYRVCRHGAQVCIYVPYMMSHLNVAHPKTRQYFNEHTPRYWTRSAHTPVYSDVYAKSPQEGWGLLDEVSPGQEELDLRCRKITFFYTPEFRGKSEEQKRLARQNQWNVCDRVLYHLIVVKRPAAEAELNALERKLEMYMPPEVTFRQYQELLEAQREEIDQLKTELYIRASEAENLRKLQAAAAEKEKLARECEEDEASLRRRIEQHQEETRRLQDEIKRQQDEIRRLTEWQEAERTARTAEVERLRSQMTSEIEKKQALLASKTGEAKYYEYKAYDLVEKVARLRNSGLYRAASRITSRSNAWDLLPPTFEPLKVEVASRLGSPEGFLLQPGIDLQAVDYAQYEVRFGRPGLKEIQMAVVLDIPLREGVVGIELVRPDNQVLARAVLPGHRVTEREPAAFQFKPVAETGWGFFYLRVFARGTKVPVRFFELRRRALPRFWLGIPHLFACFGFVDQG